MSDYDKIMSSVDNIKGLILALIIDIIKLIFFGALAIELIFNWPQIKNGLKEQDIIYI